ncbi:long-chain-fatty-acid-ligase [Micractinium conductrix]|uniref:Long-chain-fatty-acid-ligase n=1 Tax=Micractinium conductrix TaxID=554055 RepID=A0A2P6VKG6_9CHLO|nr:long-chain-fatty-acid-ligase [Micractinium conductrix]|eukprot:PSC74557.1 long-chain-fatty-acid-ligase [Micractinium conductrix]
MSEYGNGNDASSRQLSAAARAIAGLASLPEVWAWAAQQYGDAPAVQDLKRTLQVRLTFRELWEQAQRFGAGLTALGVHPSDRVALFAESSGRWVVADAGIQAAGAADAVRGVDSISTDELSFILDASGACALVAQDARTLQRLLPHLPDSCNFAVELWGDAPAAPSKPSLRVLTFDQLLAEGERALSAWQPHPSTPGDLASLMFTSGTSGHPKGVATTHSNLLSQLLGLDSFPVERGDLAVTYLPPWHSYGRIFDYYLLSRGACLYYSRLRDLKADLAEQQPHVFVSVPLLLENLHDKAMRQLSKLAEQEAQLLEAAMHHIRAQRMLTGTSLDHSVDPPSPDQLAAAGKTAAQLAHVHEQAKDMFSRLRRQLGFSRSRWVISGGGTLADFVDDFFEAIGVPLVSGYGLTETSPVLSARRLDLNIRGTIGPPLPDTDIRIVSLDDKTKELPDGQQGLILARGPQVMHGYWNDDKANDEAFPYDLQSGWFDTGGHEKSTSLAQGRSHPPPPCPPPVRQKDTIVLSNGENIEPACIEATLCTSSHIAFAVLVGQNRRGLGALLVPSPEAVEQFGQGDPQSPELRKLLQEEGGTLTRKLNPRKGEVFKKYATEVAALEQELR